MCSIWVNLWSYLLGAGSRDMQTQRAASLDPKELDHGPRHDASNKTQHLVGESM